MTSCIQCKKSDTATENNFKCNHNICHKCLCDTLTNFTSAKIACPVNGCTKVLSDRIVRKCLSNEQIVLYDKLCCGTKIVKCLIEGCNYVICFKETEGHFVCPICGQPNCLSCRRLHDIDIHCKSIQDYDPTTHNGAALKVLRKRQRNDLLSIFDKEVIPNPNAFTCVICSAFILPREGVILRNCMHQFCRSCLTSSYELAENLQGLSCLLPDCSRPIAEKESYVFIGSKKVQTFSLNIVKSKLFHCQNPSCEGLWDFSLFTGEYSCHLCHKVHCGSCKDIHEGLTCGQFRQTKRYIDSQAVLQKLQATLKCPKCSTIIIKGTGCNALRCPSCKLQVCAFSGKEIGPRGCKCTQNNRCDPRCRRGCFPDGNTPYENKIKDYYHQSNLT